MSDAYVIRWPHQGDKVAPSESSRKYPTQWLERVSDGAEIFYGGVGSGHEPEDMILGRDLNEFVDELNRQAAILARLAEALRGLMEYAGHWGWCSRPTDADCQCGFRAARDSSKAALAEYDKSGGGE